MISKLIGAVIAPLISFFSAFMLGKANQKNKNMEATLKQIRKSKEITEALNKENRKYIRDKYTREK